MVIFKGFSFELFKFDTTFFRTITPFLFKPGFLTIEFNEGRRKKYVKPIRLYLFYIRSDKYYVEHLVQALHLYSMAYLLYGIAILWVVSAGSNSANVVLGAFFLVSLYTYFSIKKVYGQGWVKTLLKFFILGFIYLIFLAIGFVIEIYITLMLM